MLALLLLFSLLLSNFSLYTGPAQSCLKEKTCWLQKLPPEILYQIALYARINDLKDTYNYKNDWYHQGYGQGLYIYARNHALLARKDILKAHISGIYCSILANYNFKVNKQQIVVLEESRRHNIFNFYHKQQDSCFTEKIPLHSNDDDPIIAIEAFTVDRKGKKIFSVVCRKNNTTQAKSDYLNCYKKDPQWRLAHEVPLTVQDAHYIKKLDYCDAFKSIAILNYKGVVFPEIHEEKPTYKQAVNNYFRNKRICKMLIADK